MAVHFWRGASGDGDMRKATGVLRDMIATTTADDTQLMHSVDLERGKSFSAQVKFCCLFFVDPTDSSACTPRLYQISRKDDENIPIPNQDDGLITLGIGIKRRSSFRVKGSLRKESIRRKSVRLKVGRLDMIECTAQYKISAY